MFENSVSIFDPGLQEVIIRIPVKDVVDVIEEEGIYRILNRDALGACFADYVMDSIIDSCDSFLNNDFVNQLIEFSMEEGEDWITEVSFSDEGEENDDERLERFLEELKSDSSDELDEDTTY